MRRFEFEGLVGFDCGEVVGFDCGDRSLGCCTRSYGYCIDAPEIHCNECLFWCEHIDAYRRWEAAGCPIGGEGGAE